MSSSPVLSTYEKALAINLDQMIYGTFAEIGAGQEIARWFFQVGGAAGTVAKTMSAYDMKYSDEIYGQSTRYVSRSRLQAMLQHEADLLTIRLGKSRGNTSKFFALADTISARNYRGDNECHGWVGLRFQNQPLSPWSDIELHVNLHDQENSLQQEAIGILGVNLIHAAFFKLNDSQEFLRHLIDGLSIRRLEIDVIKVTNCGDLFTNELSCGLSMLSQGLSRIVLLDSKQRLQVPSELFHNRPLLIERSLFRLKALAHKTLLRQAEQQFRTCLTMEKKEPLIVCGLATTEGISNTPVAQERLSQTVETLLQEDLPVLLSNFSEVFRLSALLRRYSKEPVAYVIELPEMMTYFCEKNYTALDGGILEAMSRFMAGNSKVLCAATTREQLLDRAISAGVDLSAWELGNGEIISSDSISLKGPIGHLFRYLVEIGAIESFKG